MQGKWIRFSPVEDLPESRQLRLERMYPGSQLKAGLKQLLIPKPLTSRVGGQDLTDGPLLDWLVQVFEAVLTPPSAAAAAAQSDTARPTSG